MKKKLKNMDSQSYINHFKNIYSLLITFLESDNVAEEDEFNEVIKYINEIDLVQNYKKFHEFIFIISQIYHGHHRYPEIIKRIERILFYFEKDIKRIFTNFEIFDIFSENPQILLLLLQKQIIFFDQDIIEDEIVSLQFFYPEIKSLISESKREELEKNLLDEDPDIFTNFDEKRRIGENNSYICYLIRNDLIVDFITYVNKKNISLSNARVMPSLFETNTLLQLKSTTLIKYAAFFGSIQIFQYLQNNNVKLKPSLWKYAIHGNNSEIIMILEENKIKPKKYVYEESIKCHHNEIASYIDENYNSEFEIDDALKIHYGIHYSNFSCIQCDIFNHQSAFFSILNYQKYHPFLSNLYIEIKNIDKNRICNTEYRFIDEEDITICFDKFNILIYDLGNDKSFVSTDEFDKILNCINFEDIFKIRHKSLLCPYYYNCFADKPGFIFDWHYTILYDFFDYYYLKFCRSYEEAHTVNYIIILGIAIALNHIQSLGMIHYFLIPKVIYLDYKLYPYLAGYGISSKCKVNLDIHYVDSNLVFLPPEIKFYKDFDAFNQYSNVYTFAILTYFLLPNYSNRRRDIIYIANRKISEDNNHCFEFQAAGVHLFDRFMHLCLSPDPEKRKVSFKIILDIITDHRFYRGTFDFNTDKVIEYLNIFGDEFNYLKEKIITQNK